MVQVCASRLVVETRAQRRTRNQRADKRAKSGCFLAHRTTENLTTENLHHHQLRTIHWEDSSCSLRCPSHLCV